MACGCLDTCSCFINDSATISVTGNGSSGNPYVFSPILDAVNPCNLLTTSFFGINASFFTADTPSVDLSGCGTLANPLTAVVTSPGIQQPQVRMWGSVVQSIPSGINTAVVFDTERYDTNNMWVAGFPTRLTVNTAGLYYVQGNIGWALSFAGNVRQTSLRVNGTTFIAAQNGPPTTTAANPGENLSTSYYFNVGDYVELIAAQDGGVALNMLHAADYCPSMSMVKVSD